MHADDVVLLGAWMESRDAQAFKTLTQRYSSRVYATAVVEVGDGETPFVEFEF
ncbi:MAG: hypothetical protein VCC01_00635 [Candidatus Hydrogenedentota bacterium]